MKTFYTRVTRTLTTALIITFAYAGAGVIYAQNTENPDKAEKTEATPAEDTKSQNSAGKLDSIKKKEGIAEPGSFTFDYKPRLYVMPVFSMPMGDVGSAVGMGMGFGLSYDIGLNNLISKTNWLKFMQAPGIDWRTAASFSYTSHSSNSSDFDAKATLMVVDASLKAEYPLPMGITPYGGLGLGFSSTSVSKTFAPSVTGGDISGNATASASSLDGVLAIHAGARYAIDKKFSAGLDLAYQMVFETVTGSFLVIGVHAGYNF